MERTWTQAAARPSASLPQWQQKERSGKRRLPSLLLALALGALATAPAFARNLKVTNTQDSDSGSLRQAILDARSGDRITIQVTGTITLTSGQLKITRDLTILGPGAQRLAISGNHASRVFQINKDATVALAGLTIADGQSYDGGGGIANFG